MTHVILAERLEDREFVAGNVNSADDEFDPVSGIRKMGAVPVAIRRVG